MDPTVREPGDLVGDYRLVRLIARGVGTKTWEAYQLSLQRPVVLEILRQDWAQDEEVHRAFVDDVKAKASVKHPVVGHVYEASRLPEATFLAREILKGRTLDQWLEEGLRLPPAEVAQQLESIASAYRELESTGTATVALAAHYIDYDPRTELVRLTNLSIDGAPDPALAQQDKEVLGELYLQLLERGKPGSVRIASLLVHLTDQEREVPVTWRQIEELARRVRLELAEHETQGEIRREERKVKKTYNQILKFGAAIGASFVVLGMVHYFLKRSETVAPRVPVQPVEWVPLPEKVAEGAEKAVRTRQLSREEVTVGQYAQFLEAMDTDGSAAPEQEEQEEASAPESHRPGNWDLQWEDLNRAQRREVEQRPVVWVNYENARAYARWMGVKVAEGELFQENAGLMKSFTGMSNGILEWGREKKMHPAFPLSEPYCLASDGITLRFVKEAECRSPRLGFRLER